MKRLERLCDAVVRLESFAGSDKEQNPLYKDYHGELCTSLLFIRPAIVICRPVYNETTLYNIIRIFLK